MYAVARLHLSVVLIFLIVLSSVRARPRRPAPGHHVEGFSSLAAHVDSSKQDIAVLHISPRATLTVWVGDDDLLGRGPRTALSALRPQGVVLQKARGSLPAASGGTSGLRVASVLSLRRTTDDERVAAVLASPHALFLLARPKGAEAPVTLGDAAALARSAGRTLRVGISSPAERAAFEAVRRLYFSPADRPTVAYAQSQPACHDDDDADSDCSGAWEGDVDVVAVLAPSKSSPTARLSGQKVIVLAYDDSAGATDAHRARVLLSYLHIEGVDVRRVYPKNVSDRRIMGLLAVPTALVGHRDLESSSSAGQLRLVVRAALQDDEAVALNTYYQMMRLPVYDVLAEELRTRSAAIAAARMRAPHPSSGPSVDVGRPEVPILEQFDPGPPTGLELTLSDEPLPEGTFVRHGPDQKVAVVPSDRLQRGVPLRPGDRVLAGAQLRGDDNGLYVVARVGLGFAVLESPPTLPAHGPGARARVASTEGDAWVLDVTPGGEAAGYLARAVRPGDKVVVRFAAARGPRRTATVLGSGGASGGSISIRVRLDERPFAYDVDKFHPLSLCADAPHVEIREQCPGTWDRPCERDADCPFFQANRRYPNYRGGCVAGFCELPVGLRRSGYRHYALSADSHPLCHGCEDPGDPACCAQQGGDPDYAFELDQFERMHRGLPPA
jgi:hypothetical protein